MLLAAAIHEIGHALGFSAEAFPHFRNTDGTPKTPRDSNGEPVDGQTIEACVSGSAAT